MRVIHDERAAAFYALGHARARSGSCACVVTTSGTAVANLLPAACEADRDGVSIIFATADRPAEMRGVGADQVLERQQDLLRSTVRRGADLPPADDRVAALGDLGEVSSIAAAALREEDPVSTRSGKRTSVVASMAYKAPESRTDGLAARARERARKIGQDRASTRQQNNTGPNPREPGLPREPRAAARFQKRRRRRAQRPRSFSEGGLGQFGSPGRALRDLGVT